MSSRATAFVSVKNPSLASELPFPTTTDAHKATESLGYSLWQLRGCTEGTPEQDWLEAEMQVRGEKVQTFSAGSTIAQDPPEQLTRRIVRTWRVIQTRRRSSVA